MQRLMLQLALVALAATALTGTALAADPVEDWGVDGFATVPAPAGGFATDSAVLPDGRLVIVGGSSVGPWGSIISADGASATDLSSLPGTTADQYAAVAATSDAIFAVGSEVSFMGTTGITHVFGLDGSHSGSGSISISEDTLPTNAVHDGLGNVYVAGAGRGDDDGVEPGWVVRLTPTGSVDPAFDPSILLNPAETSSSAWVGATAGSVVAAAWGEDDSGPGSAIGFHSITDTESTFMADLYTTTDVVAVDMDSSSGTAVFGVLSEGTPTAPSYALSTIGETGATLSTTTGTWVDAAGKIEAGRLRTAEVLGGYESDVNTAVETVTTGMEFATRSDAELVDVTTLTTDGSVFVTMNDPVTDEVLVGRYVGDSSGRFVDDDSSVHEADIEELEALGVTRGCNPPVNDRFCPSDDVSRGQMAAFLNRAFGLPPGAEDAFRDDDGSVFEADIDAIAAEGITQGCNPPVNDRFCPGDDVSRGQMAAFLNRAFGLPPGAEDAFRDDDGSVFEADIDAIAAEGITRGCNPPVNDRFCPGDNVTRAQMASFLVRGLD